MQELVHQNHFIAYPNTSYGIRILMQPSEYPSELSICFSSNANIVQSTSDIIAVYIV